MKRIVSFAVVLCMLLTLTAGFSVTVSAANWYDGWSLSGGASLQNGTIVVRSSGEGKLAYTAKSWQPGEYGYDIEFTMQVSTSVGGGQFIVTTGKHRLYLGIYTNSVTWHASDFDTKNTIKSFEYDIGDDEHTYRVIGDHSGDMELYIDGYYVGVMDVRPMVAEPLMNTSASYNKNGDMYELLKNVTVREVAKKSADVAAKNEEEKTEPTGAFFEDFNDGEDYSHWNLGTSWEIKDGCLYSGNDTDIQYNATRDVIFGGDFKLTWKIKDVGVSYLKYIAAYPPGKGFQMDIQRARLDTSNDIGRKFGEPIEIGDDWHEYTIETFDDLTRYSVYVDGVKYVDDEVDYSAHTMSQIRVNAWGHKGVPCDFYVDWVRYEPKDKSVKISSPLSGSEYLEGERINLKADIHTDEKFETIEYKINGKMVATGYAPDYRAAIDGLNAGNYEILAQYGDKKSEKVVFKVLPAISGSLDTTETGSGNLSVKCNLYDEFSQVDRVEYTLDGVVAAKAKSAPYRANISNITPGRHRVTAVAYSKSGMKVFETSEVVLTGMKSGKASMSYANEIRYKVLGSKGNAVYELKNGNHYVKLTHTPDAVKYLTDKGEESFKGGTGEFVVLTDGPTADVYRNGQLAFSYYLPQTTEVSTSAKENGLKITEKSVTVPEERKSYFVKRNITDKKEVYNIHELPYIYNLDFIAGSDDGLRLVVNDGYFKMDLTMEDGKFYAWTTTDDNTEPYKKYLLDVPVYEKDAYFRIETTAGMTRLYANGRWLSSFRCVHSSGGSDIGIEVLKGDGIKYLSLCDNNDIFLYYDDFKGMGEFETEAYWQMSNDATILVDNEQNVMIIDALNKNNAIAELYAFAGQAELSIDVNIKKAEGGMWFILNHNVSEQYTKIGYNFKTEKYEVVSMNNGTETVIAEAKGEFPLGRNVNMKLKANELDTDSKTATLYVNGIPVITRNPSSNMRGRIGVAMSDAFIYLDNFSYRGDAKPLAGISEVIGDSSTNNNCFYDMFETDGKMVLTHYNGDRYVSSDNGKTWNKVKRNDLDSYDITRLQSGKLLNSRYLITGKDEEGNNIKTLEFYVSEDEGETFQYLSRLPEEDMSLYHKQHSMRQGPSGRIYCLTSTASNENFGTATIWISDDDGATWKKSIFIDGVELNMTISESTIIEWPGGTTKCYFRSNSGYISYFESLDRGETWDLTRRSTPFISPANMYNIDYDPNDKGTVYIAWGYDNAGLDARVQFNRSRWGVARTIDSGETWEYLGSYFENVDGWNQFYNLSVLVGQNAFVVHAASLDGGNVSPARMITQDKSMIKPVKKFERLHMKDFIQIIQTQAATQNARERALVIYPKNGDILLAGKLVEEAAYGEYITLDGAAAYIGATVETDSADKAVLKLGTDTEVFEKDALTKSNSQTFIKTKVFAEKYGLYVTEQDGILIISPYETWSPGQIKAFRFAIDLFTDEI